MRLTKSRTYRMRRRADQIDQTRLRITEAAVHLHTTVGPAATSIAGVAAEAGVTRLTVYRHFADLDALFVACTAHWRTLNPPPDAAAWPSIPDLEGRARRAFGELYGWYQAHADELSPIYRDLAVMPMSAQHARELENRMMADAIADGHASAGSATGDGGRLLRAADRHLVDFRTWRSLALEQGLEAREAVDLAVRVLVAVGGC